MLKLVYREPDLEAVLLEDAIEHLRRSDTDEDDRVIERCLKGAIGWAEKFTGRAFLDQTWDLYLDGFPGGDPIIPGDLSRGRFITIPKPPLIEVQEIVYRDSGSASALFSDYQVDTASEPGRVYLLTAGSWPATDGSPNAVRIRFRAGHVAYVGSPGVTDGEIPEEIKAAILLYTGTLYEQRESIVVGTSVLNVPWGAEDLLRMYRVEDSMA